MEEEFLVIHFDGRGNVSFERVGRADLNARLDSGHYGDGAPKIIDVAEKLPAGKQIGDLGPGLLILPAQFSQIVSKWRVAGGD